MTANHLASHVGVVFLFQSTPLDLLETGKGLKFQAERPHLVSLGSGRLSVAITLLPLPEGETPGGVPIRVVIPIWIVASYFKLRPFWMLLRLYYVKNETFTKASFDSRHGVRPCRAVLRATVILVSMEILGTISWRAKRMVFLQFCFQPI